MRTTSTTPTHYLLTVRASIAGSKEEFGISIHPIQDRIVFREGEISRYPLMVSDMERVLDAIGTSEHKLQEKLFHDRHFRSQIALRKNYPSSPFIRIGKSSKHGYMDMKKGKNRVRVDEGYLVSVGDDYMPLEWLTIDGNYLRRFSPETRKSLEEFRLAVPR